MEKLLLLTLLTIAVNPVSARQFCVLDDVNPILSRLAERVNADCTWTIQKVVKESILEQCRNADESVEVSFRNSSRDSLLFTIYSYTYDIQKPYYYCKNKEGYNSYFSQLVSSLRSEVRGNNRVQASSSSRISYSNYSVEVEEDVKWRCIIPTYVPIPKTYTQQQKETLEFTYGNDHRFKCAKLK